MQPGQSYENYKLVDKFDTTYWSGYDVEVYVEDIYVDEAVQLNWQVLERIQPYYHYNSYVPTRLHHGSRIINGELTINSKQSGYILSLLEQVRTQGTAFSPTPNEEKPFRFEESNGVSFDPPTANKDALAAYIKNYQNSVKLQDQKVESVYQKVSPRTINYAGMFETTSKGFDLSVIFGAKLDSSLTLSYSTDNNYYARNSITPLENVTKPVTGFKLQGVSIMGSSMSIDDSGRNIMETFSFQARNIVRMSGQEIRG